MSTRCQIGFYEKGETELNNWEALLYRHSDGYPGKADGSEYGVLADIVPFLKWWDEARGIDDLEYCAARLLQYLCNMYDESTAEYYKDKETINPFTGILGHGICRDFHPDIEYFYAIYPDRLEVWEAYSWNKIQTISLKEQ